MQSFRGEMMIEMHTSLTVMSYNIQHGRGMDDRYDLVRIANVIRDSGADIIALQEVDRHFADRSNYEDTIAVLAAQLEMNYAYGANLDWAPEPGRSERRQYGIAVLSKYPIVKQRHYLLNSFDSEQRGLLETEIDVNGARLFFYATHLGLEENERMAQTEEILEIAAARAGSAVVAGDFNAYPDGPEIAHMTQAFCNVFADMPMAYTYPAGEANETLDYILVGSEVIFGERREVIQTLASDHYPIVARLSLSRER
ncbi:endonuclease/exonuclease/phosphatase family protein [Paenibacillus profundus]|uniref:Endonuclease/exonuclease/phosphatase family protein n=1 Tax=Paenibacillus profundus TaxID=1173085 RepID=A0ABS8YCX1_9BACL|nr:endonuclease/exonuclease/phosphatase family protein [Paenibacillus profundus]MCE5169079.1 endonuclease/exonuclease/phosphatase family protein [Paenibacillus profundus]